MVNQPRALRRAFAAVEILERRRLLSSGVIAVAQQLDNATTQSVVGPQLPAQSASVPNAPSNLTAASLSAIQVKLAWTNNSNETGYPVNEAGTYVEQSNDAGKTWFLIGLVDPSLQTWAVGGLHASSRYGFRVRTINPQGTSGYSN